LEGRSNLFVAREGYPYLLVAVVGFALAFEYLDAPVTVLAGIVVVVVVLVFRDPRREIPASPLGVVSPVDGRVVAVDAADEGVLQGEANRVQIRINAFGTYTARAPVEGQVKDLAAEAAHHVADYKTNAMWIRTDEGDDVVLQFHGYRFGLAPKSFSGYGQRLGQGQRCAYLRLTRFAELHLPIDTKIMVKPGQTVRAGTDLIGKLMHR
jgi:phosphatidylserine decarboxylase